MRRVLALGGVVYTLSGNVTCTQRRGLRKRRGVEGPTQAEYTNNINDSNNSSTQAVPGDGQTRDNTNWRTTAGQSNTLASSFDRIRAELRAMQEAAQDKERNAPIASPQEQEQEAAAESKNKQTSVQVHKQTISSAELDKDLLRLLQQRHRPNEAYYRGREVQDAMAIRAQLLRRQLYNETEEVIRHRNAADIAHYCRLAFPAWSNTLKGTESVQRVGARNDDDANSEKRTSAGQAAVLQRARALQDRVRDEATAIVRELLAQQEQQQHEEEGTQHKTKYSDAQSREVEAALQDAPLVRELAWVRVLDALSSDELKHLWEDGVVDYDVLESLVTDHNTSAEINDNGEEETKKKDALQAQEDVAQEEDDNNHEDDQEAGYILDDKLAALEKLEYLAALTREVHENTLQNVASLDLAPTLAKVRHGEYSAISAAELKQLEAYEEKPLVQSATHKASRQESTAVPAHIQHEVKMTEALLNQALLPSNRLPHAVARHDLVVREALDALERIKCATVLDGDFQDALQTASTLDDALEDTIRHHVGRPSLRALAAASVHHTNNEESDDDEGHVSDAAQGSNDKEERKGEDVRGRGRRQRTRYSNRARRPGDNDVNEAVGSADIRPWRGRPARPYHAADIPYFFHSLYSRVPPQADFNLPAPALSAQEKAALRGRRRRLRGPARFAR